MAAVCELLDTHRKHTVGFTPDLMHEVALAIRVAIGDLQTRFHRVHKPPYLVLQSQSCGPDIETETFRSRSVHNLMHDFHTYKLEGIKR